MYTIIEATPSQPGYQPYGTAVDLFYAKETEVCIHGPAGTGKTRACCEKLDLLAWKYPNMRGAIIRKTRASMTNTVLVTYGTKVLLPKTPIRFRTDRQEYLYPNGSTITLSGMDKSSKILSAEFDIIYVAQCEELEENDWETLLTRLRNGIVPYQQIIADANPDSPKHWLRDRMDKGLSLELVSTHQDNPTLYDHDKSEWTAEGKRYVLETLGRLTGVRLQRLRYGRWVAAEGVVYEAFNRSVHLIDQDTADQMKFDRYVVSIDWGYTNAGVMQLWGIDGDGRMVRLQEVYHSGKLIDWWVGYALEMQAEFDVEAFVCDPSGRAYIDQMKGIGIPSVAANNDIPVGIQAVASRLRVADDGLPRIMFVRDALLLRDEELAMAKQPFCTEMEFDVYVWPKGRDGQVSGERPIKKYDHGMDTMRYAVMYVDNINGEPKREVWAM